MCTGNHHSNPQGTAESNAVPRKISDLAAFLTLLKGVRKVRDGYVALCPAHDDHDPSLSVRAADRRILVYCHAGCRLQDILKTLGLKAGDLFFARRPARSNEKSDNFKPRHRRIVETYHYTDSNGNPYEAVRTVPKSFFYRQPDGKGGYINNLEGIVLTLYRQEEVKAAIESRAAIYIVEGEKDVDNLRNLGFVATTNSMGAGKWRDAYSETLRGGNLVIVPDSDGPGRKHAQEVARSCFGRANTVTILDLQDAKDITDWIERGHTIEELLQLTRSCPEYHPPEEPATSRPPGRFNLTDLGNAERLVHRFGAILHYCYERNKWLVWSGKVWEWDMGAKTRALAKETVRSIYQEAADETDEYRRKDLAIHAKRSESDSRVNAMISLAQSEKGIPVAPAHLDRNQWLFNCLNGTIDLRTGQLMPHRQNDLLTIMVPLEYDPTAQCPLWLKFLREITDGDIEMQSYLQRAVGYSLTGEITEQCFFFLYGLGNNGKSTFLETTRRIMGGYGDTMATETLMTRGRYTSGPQESLANLKGKRFVTASEVQEGRRLNVGQIKDLTGADSIKADRKYEHEIEFFPTHKLWMRGNHKPVITETSIAIWRRVKLLPLTVTISPGNTNKGLSAQLQEELPGILAWAVSGCLDWQRGGLGEPRAVRLATSDYRQESDILNDFLEDCCALEPTARVTKQELRAAYRAWCEANNQDVATQSAFKSRLIERGITEDRIHGGTRVWRGIRLSTEGDKVTTMTGNPQSSYMNHSIDKNCENSATYVTLSPSKAMDDKKSGFLELWDSLGRPPIHLGPGENCEDLRRLLESANTLPRHREAVLDWAQENGWAPPPDR